MRTGMTLVAMRILHKRRGSLEFDYVSLPPYAGLGLVLYLAALA